MIAVVLAGGLGTRLSAVVPDLPKCMSPVAGRPFLEHLLARVRTYGVTRIVLAIGHRGEVVRRHFGDGRAFGVDIAYADDGARLLGTAGALAHALPALPGPSDELVLALNGDTDVQVPLAAMVERLNAPAVRLVLVAARVADGRRFGGLELDYKGAVVRFIAAEGQAGARTVSAGAYLARRETLQAILPNDTPASLESDVLPALAGQGLAAVLADGEFVDIGVPEDYARAGEIFAERARACQ